MLTQHVQTASKRNVFHKFSENLIRRYLDEISTKSNFASIYISSVPFEFQHGGEFLPRKEDQSRNALFLYIILSVSKAERYVSNKLRSSPREKLE